MSTLGAPPSTKSIFQFPPNYPNGTVSAEWIAWFQQVQANTWAYPAPVTGYALGWDANGNLVSVPNTGADQTAAWTAADATVAGNAATATALVRSDLASTASGKGAALVGYKVPFTGSAARSQQDKNADIVSVKDFGAVGDGTTDDTAALQSAITNTYGKTLYFPSGTYKVTSALTVNSNTVSIKGAGLESTIIMGVGAINVLQLGNGAVTNPMGGVAYGGIYDGSLSDISIHGDGATLRGIWGRGARQWDFRNVQVGDSTGAQSFTIAAEDMEECYGCRWIGGFIKYSKGYGLWVHGYAGGGYSLTSNLNQYMNLKVFGCTGTGFHIMGTGQVINGVYVEQCGYGLALYNVYGATIKGGYLEANVSGSIVVSNSFALSLDGIYIRKPSGLNESLVAIAGSGYITAKNFFFDLDTATGVVGISYDSASMFGMESGPHRVPPLVGFKTYGGTGFATASATLTQPDRLSASSLSGRLDPSTGLYSTLSLPSGVNMGQSDLTNYTEGVWAPAPIAGFTPGTSPVYTGTYTRIGRMVFFVLRLQASTGSTSASATFNAPLAGSSSSTAADATDNLTTTTLGKAAVSGTTIYLPSFTSKTDVYVTGWYFA